MKNIILLTFATIIVISCKKNVEAELPEEIFERYKGSVVLIANQYYYEIHDNADVYYYSPSSSDKIFLSKDEVLKNLSFSTGTGFIVSNNGEIITNRHVVNPVDENYKMELYSFMQKAINKISDNVQKYNDSIEGIKSYYYENSAYMDFYAKERFQNKYDQLIEKRNFGTTSVNFLRTLDFSNSTLKLVTVNIGVAYDDTFVTELDDLQECLVVKQSDKENVDLALIQTKTKTFTKSPKNILNFKDNNPNLIENPDENSPRDIKKPVKINADVYMIGYNRGFALANTKQGIRSQFTIGKVSQENDNERILYTIPTLEGSSGSPIIDKWGNLVAVNFAKITDSQSFSFGIPVENVKRFYEE